MWPAGMMSPYPAELPGSTATILHSDVNKLDGESELTSMPAPVAAVTNVDALTLDTVPGVPKIELSGKLKKEKKPREKGVSYFSLYRQVGLGQRSQLCRTVLYIDRCCRQACRPVRYTTDGAGNSVRASSRYVTALAAVYRC